MPGCLDGSPCVCCCGLCCVGTAFVSFGHRHRNGDMRPDHAQRQRHRRSRRAPPVLRQVLMHRHRRDHSTRIAKGCVEFCCTATADIVPRGLQRVASGSTGVLKSARNKQRRSRRAPPKPVMDKQHHRLAQLRLSRPVTNNITVWRNCASIIASQGQ